MANLTVKIFKAWNAADERNAWVNNYEILSDDMAPADNQARLLVEELVQAEQELHLTNVYFVKAIVSTWVPEGRAEYDPSTFVSLPLDARGLCSTTGDALDSNVCFYVRKEVSSGKYGKLFYRGVLVEADVQPGGDLAFTIAPTSTLRQGGTTWTAYYNQISPFLTGGAGNASLGMIGKVKSGATFQRPVQDLVPSGVVINRRNHRYFDRA